MDFACLFKTFIIIFQVSWIPQSSLVSAMHSIKGNNMLAVPSSTNEATTSFYLRRCLAKSRYPISQ
ncbi:hypothetical protein BX666DRAFT_1916256 [Dichotomocladium elegans]|nr:hypothetical protein BX666DRAFT_1916256 [Dichotomocladium elegans]